MKDLSIEEKAKAYDEAIKKAKSKIKNDKDHVLYEDDVVEIFPELKESEDERIRKEIINYIKNSTCGIATEIYESWIDWLEKQGEHANFRNKIQIGDKVTRNEDGVLVNLSQLKRIAKPAENKGQHNIGISEATKQELEDNLNKALEKETPESIKNFIDTLEVIDPYKMWIQYASIEAGIKAHAEDYSFNIESELFQQLIEEQQKLWRKEIEQACISGGYAGYQLAKDPRYKENLEVKEVDLDVQDIYGILYLERIVMRDFGDKEYSHEELCQEVLKRFKDLKK